MTTTLRTIPKDELTKIIEEHKKWRRSGGAEGARANLAGADLAGAYLAGADLADADLARANLAGADLAGAYLARADLADADLARANLAGANLAGADLARANLAGANLAGANLARANLADADLADAYLARANLADAYLADANLAGADLAGADLADAYLADANLAGADLAGANLAGADLAGAYLAGAKNVPETIPHPPEASTSPEPRPQQTREEWEANRAKTAAERARRYRERHPDVPVVEALDAKILAAIEGGATLEMGRWHGHNPRNADGEACGTTHCRSGWSIHLAGKAGYELERKFGSAVAGRMIYSASTGRVPHFYATNENALADIRRCAAEQTSQAETPAS